MYKTWCLELKSNTEVLIKLDNGTKFRLINGDLVRNSINSFSTLNFSDAGRTIHPSYFVQRIAS